MKAANRTNLKAPVSNPDRKPSGQVFDTNPEHLLAHEIDIMKEQFFIVDKQNNGFIAQYELKSLLEWCGDKPSEEKMTQIDKWLEQKNVHRLDIGACLQVWNYLKELHQKEEEEHVDYDILNAFVSMGGNSDKTGVV